MTARKHLKQLVRARSRKTGESYTTARRHVTGQGTSGPAAPATRWHFAGRVPATTALRVLLAHAGVRDPHTGRPFSEAMLFGIAGGVGIGACAFYYLKANFASFFIAGRHLWQDNVAYLRDAAARFGLKPIVRESTGMKSAAAQLRALLAEGPCIAWVDMAHLPHRGLPAQFSGSGYHVVTIYRLDDESALIGDLAEKPIRIGLDDLARSRARIKSQKNRLMALPTATSTPRLAELVRSGLAACARGLQTTSMKVMRSSFKLDALTIWAERLHGSRDKEAWERVFAPGVNLWRGLTSVYDFIEHHGTGGGLCRPIMAESLAEAGAALGDQRLRSLAKRYADLGRQWSDLAGAALPDRVPAFREAKALMARRSRLLQADAAGAADEVRGIWARLGELARQAGEHFPLSAAEAAELRAGLQARVRALHDAEVGACAELAAAVR